MKRLAEFKLDPFSSVAPQSSIRAHQGPFGAAQYQQAERDAASSAERLSSAAKAKPRADVPTESGILSGDDRRPDEDGIVTPQGIQDATEAAREGSDRNAAAAPRGELVHPGM